MGTDTSPLLLHLVVSVLEHCQSLLTSWEPLDLELVFCWPLPSSTNISRSSSRSSQRWAAWELSCSRNINRYHVTRNTNMRQDLSTGVKTQILNIYINSY